MTTKVDYTEAFKRFNIDMAKAPAYPGAEEFANRITKCTILKYGDVSYSDTSSKLPLSKESAGT